MADLETYQKRSGFTDAGFVCGRCGKNPLPEGVDHRQVQAKIIICPYCSLPIPNKPVGE